MILYLAVTAVVLLFAAGVPSLRERGGDGETLTLKGMLPRNVLAGKVLVTGIFLLLFGVLALRVNVGNDYAKYAEFMHLARVGAYVPTEIGFNLLARVTFFLFGKNSFLVNFAAMAFVTVFCFLAAIDRLAERFFPSFCLFMLLGYYFQSISTVRYYFALAVVTLAIVYLLRSDAPRFLLLVLFAATFHKSALVVLVLYPLALIRYRRAFLIALTAGGCAAVFLRKWVLQLALFLYPTYRESSFLTGATTSAVNIARCLLVLLLTIWVDRESILGGGQDAGARARRFFCHANLLGLGFYLFFFYLPDISRIAYYLTITHIFYVPVMVLRLPEGRKRRVVTLAVLLFAVVVFAYLMRHARADGFRILPYQTFVFHDMPPILSETTGY